MGLSKGHSRPHDAIVILQWVKSATEALPRLRFWILRQESGANEAASGSLPVPTAVDDRFGESACKSGESQKNDQHQLAHFPPMLSYGSRWDSIQMHSLTVDEHVNAELTLWGPGIRLNHVQDIKVFDGAPAAPLETSAFPNAAIIDLGGTFDSDEYDHTRSASLISVAADNGDGTATVKYRAQHTKPPRRTTSTNDARGEEQTLRVAFEPEPMHIIAQKRTAPVHTLFIGSRPRYLILLTLCPDAEDKHTVLSVHTIDERIVRSEASLMAQPNEDLGFRWQVQTFKMSKGASRIAPMAMSIQGLANLFVFYFENGALRYARLAYAGSGSFADFTDGHICAIGPSSAPTAEHGPSRATPRPSWSLSSLVSSSPREHEVEKGASRRQQGTPGSSALSADRCHPRAVQANGYLWIFYNGHDGRGRYIRRKMPRAGDEVVSSGWETASWDSGDGAAESHFIPVVVSGNFMSMR